MDIFSYGRKINFPKNALLFSEGAEANGFYYVLTGEIGLFKMDLGGREAEVARLKNGDYLGEVILFAAERFPASARAVKDSSTLFFRKQEINAAIATDPQLTAFFLRLLAQKCLVLNQRIETLAFKTVRQRLLHFLLSRVTQNNNGAIELVDTKAELAKRLGTISATLSRNLAQLENEGLISVSGRRIKIFDRAALQSQLDN